MPSEPTPAPTIPPAMAAVVSLSPPQHTIAVIAAA
jgi:hypothetical protein